MGARYPATGANGVGVWFVIFGVTLGYGVIYALNYLIDKSTNHEIEHINEQHPKTADDLKELYHYDHVAEHKKHNDEHRRESTRHWPHSGEHHEAGSVSQLFLAGLVMACAIALHNLPEGMVIGSSYAGAEIGTGFSVIGLHNIPEGMAIAVPLIAGGVVKWKAILITALSGVPTIIGAALGYYLGMASPLSLSLSLSFASGAMLYVVFGELLPESILMWRSKIPAFAILVGMLVGMIIIFT
jgi:ZIP family zinc transporter